MSILEKLGLVQKPEEHSLNKLNRLQMFADISSLFAEQIWVKKDAAEMQRLINQIFDTLDEHREEIAELPCLRFGNFEVKIDLSEKDHVIIDYNKKEEIHVLTLKDRGKKYTVIKKEPLFNTCYN